MQKSIPKTSECAEYNNGLQKGQKELCDLLMREIDATLNNSTSKLYHSNPAWFIDDNPIVGYNVAKNGIDLLFWSGQSFATAGLTGAGKFKAAKTTYATKADVDLVLLRSWLQESIEKQWDYKNLRTVGTLNLVGTK